MAPTSLGESVQVVWITTQMSTCLWIFNGFKILTSFLIPVNCYGIFCRSASSCNAHVQMINWGRILLVIILKGSFIDCECFHNILLCWVLCWLLCHHCILPVRPTWDQIGPTDLWTPTTPIPKCSPTGPNCETAGCHLAKVEGQCRREHWEIKEFWQEASVPAVQKKEWYMCSNCCWYLYSFKVQVNSLFIMWCQPVSVEQSEQITSALPSMLWQTRGGCTWAGRFHRLETGISVTKTFYSFKLHFHWLIGYKQFDSCGTNLITNALF